MKSWHWAFFAASTTCSCVASAETEPGKEGELRTRYEGSHSPFGFVWQIASATGCMPIYQLSESFQLRGEFYGFIPIFPIKKDEYGQAYYGKAFTKFEYLGIMEPWSTLSFSVE